MATVDQRLTVATVEQRKVDKVIYDCFETDIKLIAASNKIQFRSLKFDLAISRTEPIASKV